MRRIGALPSGFKALGAEDTDISPIKVASTALSRAKTPSRSPTDTIVNFIDTSRIARSPTRIKELFFGSDATARDSRKRRAIAVADDSPRDAFRECALAGQAIWFRALSMLSGMVWRRSWPQAAAMS